MMRAAVRSARRLLQGEKVAAATWERARTLDVGRLRRRADTLARLVGPRPAA
eukprot:COSAG01_NODE_19511_length_1005_cov_4.221014_1_plen_51_part_10